MISLKNLAKTIENDLNNIDAGFRFKIFPDAGSFKKAVRDGNTVIKYINGVLSAVSSEVSNVSADNDKLVYATQTATLKLIYSLEDFAEDIEIENEEGNVVEKLLGYETRIEDLKEALNSYFQGIKTENIIDDDGKTFSVTSVFQFIANGERAQNSIVGDSITFTTYIYYTFIQNGLNTTNLKLELDGEPIPYQTITLFRTPTTDGNVYSNTKNGATKNISLQSNFNLSLALPAMTNNLTNRIIENVLDGEINQAHILRVVVEPNIERFYLVCYGENSVMGETIKNIGLRLSLVELRDNYENISFGKYMHIYQVDYDNPDFAFEDESVSAIFNIEGELIEIHRQTIDDAPSISVSAGSYIVTNKPLYVDAGLNQIR